VEIPSLPTGEARMLDDEFCMEEQSHCGEYHALLPRFSNDAQLGNVRVDRIFQIRRRVEGGSSKEKHEEDDNLKLFPEPKCKTRTPFIDFEQSEKNQALRERRKRRKSKESTKSKKNTTEEQKIKKKKGKKRKRSKESDVRKAKKSKR